MLKTLKLCSILCVLASGITYASDSIEEFRKAAGQGDAVAQNKLATRYFNGEGVQKDHTEAAKWYLKAAEQGLAAAQYSLGSLYYTGIGVEKNTEEGLKWYRKAADQGVVGAQAILESIEESAKLSNSVKSSSTESGDTNTITIGGTKTSTHTATLEEILNGLTKVSEQEAERLKNILNLDVIKHYDLSEKYDSDLKQKLFLESTEYADKLSELKKLKLDTLRQKYFDDISLTDFHSIEILENSWDYNIKKGGFIAPVDSEEYESTTLVPKIHSVFFPRFPITQNCYELGYSGVQHCEKYLFIPTSEEVGVRVEDAAKVDGSNIWHGKDIPVHVYIIFDIYKTYYQAHKHDYALVGTSPRIILANAKTGEVYFDKAY